MKKIDSLSLIILLLFILGFVFFFFHSPVKNVEVTDVAP
jgi:hypothetical protein